MNKVLSSLCGLAAVCAEVGLRVQNSLKPSGSPQGVKYLSQIPGSLQCVKYPSQIRHSHSLRSQYPTCQLVNNTWTLLKHMSLFKWMCHH